MAMDWELTVDNSHFLSNFYRDSCLISDYLLVTYYDTFKSNTKYKAYWVETGKSFGAGEVFPGKSCNITSMVPAKENGIYAFVEDYDNSEGTMVTLRGYFLALLNLEVIPIESDNLVLNIVSNKTIFPDSNIDEETEESFRQYPPTKIFLYYPKRSGETEFPAVLLMGNKVKETRTGLLIYGFNDESNDYGYNPFAMKSDSDDCAISVSGATSGTCLSCSNFDTKKYLTKFKCDSTCGHRFYEHNSSICYQCHHTCASCTGPLRNHCLECTRSMGAPFNMLLGQCFVSSNPGGDQINKYRFNKPRDMPPTYAFNLIKDYSDTFLNYKTSSSSTSLTMFSCIQLPIKDTYTEIPEEFTIGFWFLKNEILTLQENQIILSAFGNIEIRAVRSPMHTVKFVVKNEYNEITQQMATKWDKNWKYISISIHNTPLGYVITTYVYNEETLTGEVSTKKDNLPIAYKLYDKHIYFGCNSQSSSTDLYGYLRDLVYIPKYFGKEDMEISKSIGYHKNFQIFDYIAAYWKFDVASSYKDIINEETPTFISAKEVNTNSNSLSSRLTRVRLWESKWGLIGTAFDLFGYSNFPAFSFDTLNFGPNELEPKINLNTFTILGAIIKKNDRILYTFKRCSENPEDEIGSAQIIFNLNKVKIKQDKGFTQKVRGKFVNTCYCSVDDSGVNSCFQLGRTYFPMIPTQIFPAHGKSDAESDPIEFELRGGDQSYGDKLTLIKINKDVRATTKETIVVDEKDSGYVAYTTVRWTDGEYGKISVTSLDYGVYTVGWRPSYMSYLADERNVVYKNLFNTWTIQGPPKIRFPFLENMPDVFNFNVEYKGEYYYLDLVGEGQADGDQIIFCHTGCSYQNAMSRPIQRENNRYPPIWIGEEHKERKPNYGIWGVGDAGVLGMKLFVCWRPASRSLHINPEDDKWNSLEDFQGRIRATISINNVKKEKPEIVSISLNMGDNNSEDRNYPVITPVLYQGDTLWFKFASPCPSYVDGGKIEISHVTYNTYKKDSYTLEPVWVQEMLSQYRSGNNMGKIRLDSSDCNYTLQEIPYSKMKPGHDYMLIIYSRSFFKESYFGSDVGGIPQFKYLFKYQESTFVEQELEAFIPSDTKIVIKGTNFGNLFIPGNGFVESRKLFSLAIEITADPPCNGGPIRASYIPEHMEQNPTEIVIQDVDLSTCTSFNILSVYLKLIKISDDFTAYPLWSTTNSSRPLKIAKVGCDPSCKTCTGPTSSDCLTCDINGKYPYLYKSRCLSKCENDLPYTNIVLVENSFNFDYYECTDQCNPGYYLDKKYGVCLECNYQCGTCSSGATRSCTGCKGTYINRDSNANDMNEYRETFFFKGMCILSCPVINKVEGNDNTNVIKTNSYEHTCLEDKTKIDDPREVRVDIQQVIFTEKVNIKKAIHLRALLTDLRVFDKNTVPLTTKYIWSAHPKEDTTVETFYSSDKRVFLNYTEENLQRAITSLNMNSFNYKSENDQMRVIVRIWTNGYFDYDMIELFGNKPPELEDEKVKIRYSGNKDLISTNELKTKSEIDIYISNVKDSDDYFPKIYYKVLLVPRSLVLPPLSDNITTSESTLSLLTQLPEQYMVLYSNKQAELNDDGILTLKNIYIPPLINGYQVISKNDGIYSNNVSCDLLIYAEDRYSAVSKLKFVFNILEVYTSDKIEETIEELTKIMEKKNESKTIGWNEVLQIAHTLKTINSEHTMYYMSYGYCSRDDQCNNGGKCVTSGGWSKCDCAAGFTGMTCNWGIKQFMTEQRLIELAIEFLNNTVKLPVNRNPDYEIEDTNIINQVANVLIGMLKNPEIINDNYFDCIIELARYITQINYITGGRLEEYERNNILTALDSTIKYVYYYMRRNIYKFYLFEEIEEFLSDQQIADYNVIREKFAETIMKVRNALYKFVDAISLVQYPLRTPYSVEYNTFELFLSAEMEKSMFKRLGDALAIQLHSGKDYVRIPSTLLNTMRKEVSIDEEFKIRIIKWKENPYLFSNYHSEICTSVFNFALMNSDSKIIDTVMNEPVVVFTPISKAMKNLPTKAVRCMYFDNNKTIQSKVRIRSKVNVNQLRLTDEEKRAIYPEWNPEFYQSKNLIVEEMNYKINAINQPEFNNTKGFSSYGNILDPRRYLDMVSCALYGVGEVAGIAERRRSHSRGAPSMNFYNDFDVLENYYFNIGIYTCIVIGVLMVLSLIGSYMLDLVLLPSHKKLINSHRAESSEKNQVNELASEIILTVNSNSNDINDGHAEDIKTKKKKDLKNQVKRRIRKSNSKRNYKKRTDVVNSLKSLNTQSKDLITEEKSALSRATNSVTNQSQTRTKLKDNTDADNTTQNHTTIQESLGNTIDWFTSELQKTGSKEQQSEKLFSNLQNNNMQKKDKKENWKLENIFSKEHSEKRESQEFEFLNNFIASNLLLNLITRNNNIYKRPERCIVMFSYIYIVMFWCAIFMSAIAKSLISPELNKTSTFLANRHIWIIFISPIFASVLLYLVAGVYKVEEKRIQEVKTASYYQLVL